MTRALAILLASAIAAPAAAGIVRPPPSEPEYTALARPICAAADELDARLAEYGLTAGPRMGTDEPTRGSRNLPRFVQEWDGAEGYGAITQGDRAHLCVIAVAKDAAP